jgi:cyanophycinase-like exopeptidase
VTAAKYRAHGDAVKCPLSADDEGLALFRASEQHPAMPKSIFPTASCALALTLLLPISTHAADTASAHPRELVLAGGALRLCSSLSPKDCVAGAEALSSAHRGPPRYALTATAVEAALDPRLWPGRDAQRDALRPVLESLRAERGDAPADEDALRDRFEIRCGDGRDAASRCRDGGRPPWLALDDDSRAAVLAALELPQMDNRSPDGMQRRRERASLAQGRNPHGAAILRAFVAAARERADGATPKIAVVTASSYDPFDPVDVYLDALAEAGAEVEWWPLDAALAAAVFERRDCAALPALRVERLRLPARERIYPDLVAQQQRGCADPDALATLPARVQGVFFTGGDQWKLRRAFFDAQDQPNPWLLALRDAVSRGAVVVGGTSAGSAVQSGAPMLSNGTVEQALLHGAIASPPPVPGCARSGDCVGGLDEDAFTYWPAGGLALAPGLIVDTHFSERAREARLLRLLADTTTRFGIGIDETSALQLRWRQTDVGETGFVEVRALGASGGWVFDASPGCDGDRFRAQAHYLAPGAVLRMDADGLRFDALPAIRQPTPDPPSARDAIDPGALRGAAQRMAAADGADTHLARVIQRLRAIDGTASLVRTSQTAIAHAPDAAMASIGPLRIEIAPWSSCVP